MIINLNEAFNILRTEQSVGNLEIVSSLIDAIPSYISTTTGITNPTKASETYPLIKTLAKFLLCLWYNPDGTDATQLQTVVDNLLKTLKADASSINEAMAE